MNNQDLLDDDRRLVARFLKSREEKAFRQLYRRHAPVVYKLILRLLGGVEPDAEEVLQVTWTRAVAGLPRFRWESSLRSWLSGIAVNCSREQLRRRRRAAFSELPDVAELPQTWQHQRPIDHLDLERAIAQLPDGYREVLVLHDVEGYTHQEIGNYLGIPVGTSTSQLYRARRAVRELLNAEDNRRELRRAR